MTLSIVVSDIQWKITSQAPVGVGARAEGDKLPVIPECGLRFHSDKGESLFLPIPYIELPSEEALNRLPEFEIARMIAAARSGAHVV